MILLGLDASAKAASCAVFDSEARAVVSYGGVNAKITHSETLMPLAESILTAAKLSLSDIDAFAVTNGPGSFTGVRIAVSAVKGMAFALEKPVFAVSSLLSLGYNLIGHNSVICAVMDARRGQFYNALFKVEGEKVSRLTPDRAIGGIELSEELYKFYKLEKNESEKIIITGDGAELFYNEFIGDNADLISLASVNNLQQNAVSVCLAAFYNNNKNPVSAKELLPLYLRLPQAERERVASVKNGTTITATKSLYAAIGGES